MAIDVAAIRLRRKLAEGQFITLQRNIEAETQELYRLQGYSRALNEFEKDMLRDYQQSAGGEPTSPPITEIETGKGIAVDEGGPPSSEK
jgi:hypothetical protein